MRPSRLRLGEELQKSRAIVDSREDTSRMSRCSCSVRLRSTTAVASKSRPAAFRVCLDPSGLYFEIVGCLPRTTNSRGIWARLPRSVRCRRRLATKQRRSARTFQHLPHRGQAQSEPPSESGQARPVATRERSPTTLASRSRVTKPCSTLSRDQAKVGIASIELARSLQHQQLESVVLLSSSLVDVPNQVAQATNHGVETMRQNADLVLGAVQIRALFQVHPWRLPKPRERCPPRGGRASERSPTPERRRATRPPLRPRSAARIRRSRAAMAEAVDSSITRVPWVPPDS